MLNSHLDNLVYKNNDIGVFDTCKDWLTANKDIYTILTLNNKVIGYINFMAITDDCYNQFKLGKFKDYNLKNNHILPFKTNTPLKCLFTSIVIHPNYQNGTAILRLWNGFKEKIKALISSGMIIDTVIMDCVTDIGKKCAINYLNAKYICDSDNGKIFEGNLDFIN